MAEELLPLIGHGVGNGDDEQSGSDTENSQQDSMSTEEDEEKKPKTRKRSVKKPVIVTYDSALPGSHSYLGDDLEDLRGRTIHDDDSLIDLPIISLPGVVLVPGQTIPLSLFHPQTVAMVRNVIDKDKTFGLVSARYNETDASQTLASVGTTAEIFSVKQDMDERSGISTLRVKAQGRQRFEICETNLQITGTLVAKVRILPERHLTPVLEGATPQTYRRTGATLGGDDEPIVNTAVDRRGKVISKVRIENRNKIDRFRSAHFTWWPPWVYKMYDERILVERIKEELHSWNETLRPQNMPSDPVDFSFWVAQNLPVDDSMRLHLLHLHTAVQRLRCELSVIQKCTVLCCRDCNQDITNKEFVFSMAVEGPLGAYVNPGGHVHETLTVYKAHGLHLIGSPSSEHSWFPGYAWTIAQCQQCSAHMGWRFTATNKKLSPQKFWGICRASLIASLQNTDEWVPTI